MPHQRHSTSRRQRATGPLHADRTRAREYTSAKPATVAALLDALSDAPIMRETHAWFTGRIRTARVLELRMAALLPDAQPITCTDRLAAWASRQHSATLVHWLDDGTLELTVDEDLEQAIAVIRNDIASTHAQARHSDGDPRARERQTAPRRYGQVVGEPVITRIVAVQEMPPGSRATRRLIAEWSDGSESEALAWFADEWLVSEGDLRRPHPRAGPCAGSPPRSPVASRRPTQRPHPLPVLRVVGTTNWHGRSACNRVDCAAEPAELNVTSATA